MAEENVIKTKQGSYITGIIGSIIGGLIATIPWILAYVYGGMMLSILATLIAAGEFYGYKLLRGRINKFLPAILMILALIIVTIATLIIIPGLLIQKEGINVSITNVQRLYSNTEFSTAIMKDFVISVIFTTLGASIVTRNIKKQIENNEDNEKDIKLDLNNTEETIKMKKEAIELVKPIFIKYEAINKEKAMIKEEVLAEIENENAKSSFNYLKQIGIIKKCKGKYYYSEDNENKQIEIKKISTGKKVFLIIVILLFIIAMVAAILDNTKSNSNTYQDGNISFEVGGDWSSAEAEYNNEWNFYKYINTVPVLNSENTLDENDYLSYPAGINVYYDKADTEVVKNIEDIKNSVQTNIEQEDKAEIQKMDISKTTENYDLLKVKIVYNNYPEEILYYYYILNEDELTCVTAYSFNLDDDKSIEKESDKLVNSFKWL